MVTSAPTVTHWRGTDEGRAFSTACELKEGCCS